MSIFLVVFVVMIPVSIYLYGIQIREYRAKTEPRPFPVRIARGLAWIGLLGVALLLHTYIRHGVHFVFHPLGQPPTSTGHDGRPHNVAYKPTFQWSVLWAALVVLAGTAGWTWYRIRRFTPRPLFPAHDPTVAEDVAESISDAIDDLEAEPDARRAVIAAYARMEQTFDGHGFSRIASETPTEYLRRILLDLGSRAESVMRLTDLFELAKFSRHEIGSGMKHDAIAALRSIRDDLRGAPA